MIVTFTPNPSLDRTIELDRLVRGSVNRATDCRVDPGGKGVNVSRTLAAHGVKTTAVLPLGGPDGVRLTDLLAGLGIDVRGVGVAGGVRSNVTVAEPDGLTTKLNEPGPTLTAAELEELSAAVLACATPGTWVVACGSLPGGAPASYLADLVAPLHARGARVVVDSSHAALLEALTPAPGRELPDLVKPNREELAEAVGRPLHTLGDVVAAARELAGRGVGLVLASLGADGAVLADVHGAVHGESRVAQLRSTVGAGDAMLAGFLSVVAAHSAPTTDPPPLPAATAAGEALATALAWGAAATGLPGSRMPGPVDVAAVSATVHDQIDERRLLEGDPA